MAFRRVCGLPPSDGMASPTPNSVENPVLAMLAPPGEPRSPVLAPSSPAAPVLGMLNPAAPVLAGAAAPKPFSAPTLADRPLVLPTKLRVIGCSETGGELRVWAPEGDSVLGLLKFTWFKLQPHADTLVELLECVCVSGCGCGCVCL